MPPMVLTALLPTAWADTLLPLFRSAEPFAAPVGVMLKATPLADARTAPLLVCTLLIALDGTPAPKVDMAMLLLAVLP